MPVNSLAVSRARSRAVTAVAAALLWPAAAAFAAEPVSTYGSPAAPKVAQVYNLEVRTRDPAEMAYVVAGELIHRYAEAKKIMATDQEISAYVADVRRFMDEERTRQLARKAEIQRRLQDRNLPAAERQALEKQAAMITSLFERPEKPDAATEREIATGFIKQWKVNRELYREHGGRVIYQQSGPEPLDAYRKFFEAEQAKGSFRILDAKFAQEFWSYYRDEKRHVFMPQAEAKAAMETAPWERKAAPR